MRFMSCLGQIELYKSLVAAQRFIQLPRRNSKVKYNFSHVGGDVCIDACLCLVSSELV